MYINLFYFCTTFEKKYQSHISAQTAQATIAIQHSPNSQSKSEQQQQNSTPMITTRIKIVRPIIKP